MCIGVTSDFFTSYHYYWSDRFESVIFGISMKNWTLKEKVLKSEHFKWFWFFGSLKPEHIMWHTWKCQKWNQDEKSSRNEYKHDRVQTILKNMGP